MRQVMTMLCCTVAAPHLPAPRLDRVGGHPWCGPRGLQPPLVVAHRAVDVALRHVRVSRAQLPRTRRARGALRVVEQPVAPHLLSLEHGAAAAPAPLPLPLWSTHSSSEYLRASIMLTLTRFDERHISRHPAGVIVVVVVVAAVATAEAPLLTVRPSRGGLQAAAARVAREAVHVVAAAASHAPLRCEHLPPAPAQCLEV